jgi:hypothetical protein
MKVKELFDDTLKSVADNEDYEITNSSKLISGKRYPVILFTKIDTFFSEELEIQYLVNPGTGAWSFSAGFPSEKERIEFHTGEDDTSLIKHMKKKKKLTANQVDEYFGIKDEQPRTPGKHTLQYITKGELQVSEASKVRRGDEVFVLKGKTTLQHFCRGALKEERSIIFSDIGDSLPDLNDEHLAKTLGTSDGYTIWGSRHFGATCDTYCIADNNKKPIALVSISTIIMKSGDIEYQDIDKIWVDERHRGKALTASIIQFIVKKLNTSLGSGKLITFDGEKLFRKLLVNKKYIFKILDIKTKKPVDIEDVNKIFALPNNYEIIIVEGWGGRSYGKQYLFEPNLLDEMRCFRGDDTTTWD